MHGAGGSVASGYRVNNYHAFLSSQTCNNGSEECNIRERVYKLNRKSKLKWPAFYTERWEAAAGFRCGNWANCPGGWFVLFCGARMKDYLGREGMVLSLFKTQAITSMKTFPISSNLMSILKKLF